MVNYDLKRQMAAVPDQPSPPTTTISQEEVMVEWTAPYDNESPITAYIL